MRRTISIVFAVMSAVSVAALAAGAEPKSEEQKTLYAIGLALSNSLASFNLSEADLEMVKAGLSDGVLNKDRKVDIQTYGPKIQELQRTRLAVVAEKEKKTGKAYADKAASAKGAKKTASGLVYVPIKTGTGASPNATDTVKVHYHGTLVDGTVFDSSVQLMKVGEKGRLVCPSNIAYGDSGRPPKIPPGATLIFEVELLDIEKAPAAEPPPKTK